MKRLGCICFGLVVAGAAQAQPLVDQDLSGRERAAQSIYQTLLAARSEAALSTTRDADDKVEIERLISFARVAGGRPELQARLYFQAEQLATSCRDGEGIAVIISQHFRTAQPLHRWCNDTHQLALYEKWYARADREDRKAMSEDYIVLLLAQSVALERTLAFDEALALNRTALSVARAADSVYKPLFEQRGRDLSQLRRHSQRLDQLLARLADGSLDQASARELAMWLAAERSDFAGALAAAQSAGDERLVELVTLASLPASELEAGDALAVAQWFIDMAEDDALPHDRARLGALYEARFYYHHYLKIHPEQDVLRLRVLEIALGLTDKLTALEPDPPHRPAGPWRSLLGGIREPRTGDPGNLVGGNHLRVRNNTVYAHKSAFTVPVVADDDYEFRMAITRTHANDVDGFSFYFPIGDKGGWMLLAGGGDEGSYLRGVQRFEELDGFRFPEDTPVAMVVTVHRSDQHVVHITLQLDNVTIMDWAGPIQELEVPERYGPPEHHGNIFRVSAGTTYEFQHLEYRRAEEE